MLRPPALCCKTFLWPTFPPRHLGAFLSGLLEMLSPGPAVVKKSHWIKHNSQFVGCKWFLSLCNQSDSWVLVCFLEILLLKMTCRDYMALSGPKFSVIYLFCFFKGAYPLLADISSMIPTHLQKPFKKIWEKKSRLFVWVCLSQIFFKGNLWIHTTPGGSDQYLVPAMKETQVQSPWVGKIARTRKW